MRIRFATWNIHSCIGTDGAYDPERVARNLARLKADVIGLQEVDWRKPNIGTRDQLEYFAHALGMHAIEGPNLKDHEGTYGNALLTRLEIESEEKLELAHRYREPRGLIDARLRAGEHRLRALVTHLGLSWFERRRQLKTIGAHLDATDPGPCAATVLMGDINEWLPRTLHNAPPLTNHFQTQFAPRTFPVSRPIFRLDRILISSGVDAQPAHPEGFDRAASDHLPVCVDVTLPQRG